jgi:hypothetical protein
MKNQLPTKVKLKASEIMEIYKYITICITKQYENINDDSNIDIIYNYHLIELFDKCDKAYLKCLYTGKKGSIYINEIEKHVMAIFFNKIEPTGYMVALMNIFTDKLVRNKPKYKPQIQDYAIPKYIN